MTSAEVVDRCFRCGGALPGTRDPNSPLILMFCTTCIPIGTAFQREIGQLDAGHEAGATGFVDVDATRDDLGEFGTPEHPRIVEIPRGTYGDVVIERRPGEQVEVRSGPLRVRIVARFGEVGRKPTIEVRVTLNDWSRRLGILTDRLQWFDRGADEHLEVVTRARTSEILWTSGWTKVSDHKFGGHREESSEVLEGMSLSILPPRSPLGDGVNSD